MQIRTLISYFWASIRRNVQPAKDSEESAKKLPPIRYHGDPTEIYLA